MIEFLDNPILKVHPEEKSRFILEAPLTRIRSNESVTVPAGYEVNEASIPRILLPFFDRWHPDYSRPSIIHDALVGEFDQDKIRVTRNHGSKEAVSWKEAACWFSDGMKKEGAGKLKRRAFYHAVMSLKRVRRILKNFR